LFLADFGDEERLSQEFDRKSQMATFELLSRRRKCNTRLLKALRHDLQKSQKWKNGRGERIRTSDPLVPNQVRYQTALRPEYLLRCDVDERCVPRGSSTGGLAGSLYRLV
jgi:hypothetical protein